MIVRKNLKWTIILKTSGPVLLVSCLLATFVYLLYFRLDLKSISLPFAPIAVVGTALSIFLGFRNSSSYDRWWEARKIWGGIVNYSRTFARQVISFGMVRGSESQLNSDELRNYHRELIYRHLAWVNALRFQLRQQTDPALWKEYVQKFLPENEWKDLAAAKNKCTQILLNQSRRIVAGLNESTFDNYRHMQLDNTLTELYNLQGQCERIKNTPLPRQYDYFNRLFTHLFLFFLPFGMLEIFNKTEVPLLIIPFSVVITWVFFVIEGVGRRIEEPFENKITDTPITALCRTIEIDLRQMLGEEQIPEKLEPVDGFLF